MILEGAIMIMKFYNTPFRPDAAVILMYCFLLVMQGCGSTSDLHRDRAGSCKLTTSWCLPSTSYKLVICLCCSQLCLCTLGFYSAF